MAIPANSGNVQSLREFLLQYNKLTEICFNKCVLGLNERLIDSDEASCVDCCIDQFVRFNQRAMTTFAEAQRKKQQDSIDEYQREQQQQQQQQQQTSLPTIEQQSQPEQVTSTPAVTNVTNS